MDSVLEVNLLNGIKIDTEHVKEAYVACKIIVKVISVCFVLQQKVIVLLIEVMYILSLLIHSFLD